MTQSASFALPAGLGGWCLVGNMTRAPRTSDHHPGKTVFGTPAFAGGAKLYLGAVDFGGWSQIGVVGQNRVSKKLSASVIRLSLFENVRVQLLRSPAVIKRLLTADSFSKQTEDTRRRRNPYAGIACLFENKRDAASFFETFTNARINHKDGGRQ